MQRSEEQLDIKILLYVNRDKPSRISRSKHPAQDARTINEKDDEKGTARKFNQRKVSYHSTGALNSHNRDPIRLNNHHNLPNKYQTEQPNRK
jgi:hypothetical protein